MNVKDAMPQFARMAQGAELVALGFGLLSVAFGGAMLAAPRTFAKLLSMPESTALIRGLAVRDLLIGGALLVPTTRRAGLMLRAAADTCDGVLIGYHALRAPRAKSAGVLEALTAFTTAACSLRSCARLRRS